MSRSENRRERSADRSADNKRKKLIFWVAMCLYILPPLFWSGAVEFGYVKPLQNPDFLRNLNGAQMIILVIALHNISAYFPPKAKGANSVSERWDWRILRFRIKNREQPTPQAQP